MHAVRQRRQSDIRDINLMKAASHNRARATRRSTRRDVSEALSNLRAVSALKLEHCICGGHSSPHSASECSASAPEPRPTGDCSKQSPLQSMLGRARACITYSCGCVSARVCSLHLGLISPQNFVIGARDIYATTVAMDWHCRMTPSGVFSTYRHQMASNILHILPHTLH